MHCEAFRHQYLDHVDDELRCVRLDRGRLLINLPLVYSDGDVVELMLRPAADPDRVLVTDAGDAIGRLRLGGLKVDSGRVAERITEVLRGYGVERDQDQLLLLGPESEAAELAQRLGAAMLAVDALSALRGEQRPGGFADRLINYFRANFEHVEESPTLRGGSGSSYQVTAAVAGRSGDLTFVQALSARGRDAGREGATRAFRIFSDVNGQLPTERKLVVIEDATGLREGDLRLLARVAYIGSWDSRGDVSAFLVGELQPPPDRLLLAVTQTLD